jgi:hypothetical protein
LKKKTTARRPATKKARAVSKKPKASARKPRVASRKPAKAAKKQRKSSITRSRTTKPARATGRLAKAARVKSKARRSTPIPSPLPTRHVAPALPAVTAPARSMPPLHEPPIPTPGRPLVVSEFAEAGVLLAITYSIRDGRRSEFFDLMKDLRPLLNTIGGADCTFYEDRSRPNYFMEVFRFKDEAEFTAFDDKFHKDRKIAAIYSLLDDIVESEKSDFKIFERKL